MSLKEQLLNDMKDAMKSKDTIRKDTIQIVRAAVLQVEKDDKVELKDDDIIKLIVKEVKKRNDVLPDYIKSGREDSVAEIHKQIAILESYLPEQLSEEEVEKAIAGFISELGATSMKDMGGVMKKASEELSGRADNKIVSTIVKKLLS